MRHNLLYFTAALILAAALAACNQTPAATSAPDLETIATSASPSSDRGPTTGAAQTDVTLTSADGVKLAATYFSPPVGPAAGVVLLHMLGRQRSDWDAFAHKLQDQGYGVIAVDLRGHGQSEGTRDFANMTQDAAAAVAYLRASPEIDPDRIVVMGASIGGNIALNYAAADPDVAGVVLLSPGLDYRGVTTADAVTVYGDRPLLLSASGEDSYAARSAHTLEKSAQNSVLIMLKNQGHGTQMLGKPNGLEEQLRDWLKQTTAARN